jgi:hypothetical protein
MTDKFELRGKQYLKFSDGMYYRKENLENKPFSVPMHINRIPNGWQIRIQRQKKYFSKSFFDGPDSPKGPWAKLSEQERLIKRIQRSLDTAIKELKSMLKKGDIDTRDVAIKKARKSISSHTRETNNTGVPGLVVKLFFPKETAREKTPFVTVHSRLGQGSDLMLGPSFRTSIFKLTPRALQKQVTEAVKARKFMEHCQANGKRFSMEKIRFLSFEEDKRISQEASDTQVSFDDLLYDAEKNWELPHSKDSKISIETVVINDRSGIEVQRVPKRPGQRRQLMRFFHDDYTSIEQCNRVAQFYGKYLQSTSGTINKTSRAGRKRLSADQFNAIHQKKTGMTGVTYAIYQDLNRFEFIAVWHDGSQKQRQGFSVRKFGLKEAFFHARKTFNEKVAKEEGESILNMRYEKLLPMLLRDLPQSIIDNFDLATEFQGISYSSFN